MPSSYLGSRWAVAALCLLVLHPSARAQSAVVADSPFYQDYHEAFPLPSVAENDVRAVAFDGEGRLWAATGDGVRWLDGGKWRAPEGGRFGPAHALCRDRQGTIWVGAWKGLYRATPERVSPTPLHGSPIGAVCAAPVAGGGDELFAGGPEGIWRGSGETWSKLGGAWHRVVRALMPAEGGRLWIGTASGLYLQDLAGDHPGSVRYSRPPYVVSSNIGGLARLPDGEMGVASTGGLDFFSGLKRVRSLTAASGMPFHDARSVTRDGDGRLWIATRDGIARYDHGRWSLRHSRRWLSSDDARDVAVGPDGTAWIATAGGVDAIKRRRMTLAAKAVYFLSMVRARHVRPPGLVGPAVLLTPGDLSRSFIEDDDNDGEHTGMYCAMESMRYAVTHDPSARDSAKAAFHALLMLQRETGTRHFIARSLLPFGTAPRHEVDRTFTPEEIAELHRTDPRAKIIEKRWIPTADGNWLWKRDASSDEVDGHMFGYAAYYDLAADASERKLAADQVDRLIGGIVDHGFVLQDVDGRATQWGDWSPASLNGDPTWHEERAGNSVEMIAFLGVAFHMTGNSRYQEAARRLLDEHGYGRNMLQTIFDTPSERTHIEDELLTMVYANLLTHPLSPAVGVLGRRSMQLWHRSAERDGIPFYDFVYNRFSGRKVSLDHAVETLRDWPLDMIEWTVDNSRRDDVRKDMTPGLEVGMLTRILPRSEMGICMWDQEPYKAVIGNGGQREDKPTDWLLAYWMGRYYGLLGD